MDFSDDYNGRQSAIYRAKWSHGRSTFALSDILAVHTQLWLLLGYTVLWLG